MADHVVSLSALREDALQKLVDAANTPAMPGLPAPSPLKTKDDLIREWVLDPIQAQIRRDREAAQLTFQQRYDAATDAQKTEINQILGII